MRPRERFLAACRSEPVDRPPVWLMRQAGRYLPEYRELRGRHSFWHLVKTPEVAAEVTLQPLRRFGMDAGILFSDILVVLDAMGIEVRWEEGPPKISSLVESAAGLDALRPVEASQAFDYIGETVALVCKALHPDTAVIGFAGAPFTLAAYLVEGGPSRDVHKLKVLALRDPPLYHAIAGRIADAVAGLLAVQIRAGVDVVQLFDTWAQHLSPAQYEVLALPHTARVIKSLSSFGVPVVAYVRNAAGLLEVVAKSGCQVVSVDGSMRLEDARRRLPAPLALQGNFDPALLFAPEATIAAEVRAAIDSMRGHGYIVNLGQGLVPGTPIEGVAAFVNAVREGG